MSVVSSGAAAVSGAAGATWLFKGAAGFASVAHAVGDGNLLMIAAGAGAVAVGAHIFAEG